MAGQIAKLYPIVRTAYVHKFKNSGWEHGSTGLHVNYNACYIAFNRLFRYAEMHWLDIAMPKIGSGLAGGKWCEVEKVLLKALDKHDINVDVYYL